MKSWAGLVWQLLHSLACTVCFDVAGDYLVEYMGHLVRPFMADHMEQTTYNDMVGAGEPGSAACFTYTPFGPGMSGQIRACNTLSASLSHSVDRAGEGAAGSSMILQWLARRLFLCNWSDHLMLTPDGSGCLRAGTYIFQLNDKSSVDATRGGNMAHLINHSCAPVAHSRMITVRDPRTNQLVDHVVIVASKDLQPGRRGRDAVLRSFCAGMFHGRRPTEGPQSARQLLGL